MRTEQRNSKPPFFPTQNCPTTRYCRSDHYLSEHYRSYFLTLHNLSTVEKQETKKMSTGVGVAVHFPHFNYSKKNTLYLGHIIAGLGWGATLLWSYCARLDVTTGTHKLWPFFVMYSTVVGPGVLLMLIGLVLYMLGKSNQMSAKHNEAIYMAVVFNLVFFVLGFAGMYNWLNTYGFNSTYDLKPQIDLSTTIEPAQNIYFSVHENNIIFSLLSLVLLWNAVASHMFPEGFIMGRGRDQ
jgi:hypothetical protein